MADILITVSGQSMVFTSMPVIASHGVNEDYVEFTFDADWTGYAKVATFYHERTPETIYTTIVNGSNRALVPHEVTETAGRIFIGVTGTQGNIKLTSEVLPYPILPGSDDDGVNTEDITPDMLDQILSAMAEMVGTPLTANTAADMTDTTRIYVYTGSEAGYANGSWYYYDGTSWQVGGTYNSQAISDAFYNDIAQLVKQSAVASESDSVPYLFRPTPNPSAILADEEIVGGTVAFNQLCNSASVTVPNGHKYYLLKAGASSITASTGAAVTGLTDGTDMVIDLTAMLGSTIADYLNTLESGTAGAGVAKLREWGFLSKVYFPYNAGELVSVNTEGKRVVGPNECYHEPGTSYNIYNGGHLIPVKAGEKIYVYGEWTYTSSASMWGGVFATPTETSKNNKLMQLSNFTAGSVKTYDITTDGYFGVAFNAGVNTYNITKMMISRINTTYQPYRVTTYPTTPTDLNGIFKLDANNNLYADGDVYKADGTIARRYGVVDLGTLSWSYYSATTHFYATVSGAATTGSNFICDKYVYGGVASTSDMADKPTGIYRYSNIFRVKDTAYTDAATFKTAMSGQYLCYELATPTTDTADPYTATQIVGKGGTEEWLDSRSVPVPVGHNTTYYIGVPDVPSNANNATLHATVSGGKTTLTWS